MPCHQARARELLTKGKAAVFRQAPFTIILLDREDGICQDISLKLDPGSKTTGIALVADFKKGAQVVWAAHLKHRGAAIKKALDQSERANRLMIGRELQMVELKKEIADLRNKK